MELFNKPLNQVKLDDIQTIFQDKVPESRILDYKLKIHPMTDGGNKEFLKDVSAFANTMGGYLIYGIEEDEGIPIGIEGVYVEDFDKLKLHFENLLRTGVDPVIRGVDFQAVDLDDSKKIVIIEVPRSIARPHVVKIKNHFRFYGRNSAGVYPLEIVDLKRAFLASETLATSIRNFRADRLSQIVVGETPVPLIKGGKIVLHLIPVSAFELGKRYDLTRVSGSDLSPIYASGWNHRVNFDGLVTYMDIREEGYEYTYTQLFHNGIIEAVDALLLQPREKDKIGIPSVAYEKQLIQALNSYFLVFSKLDVDFPIWVCLSLIGVKDYVMWVSERLWIRDVHPIDRNELIIPEIQVEQGNVPSKYILKPAFDSIWNACGYERSFNYDNKGEWKGEGK